MNGTTGNDAIFGLAGPDILRGGAGIGVNVINGAAGIDTVSYASGVGNRGVVVSLAVTTAQATGGSGSDTLLNIEKLIGSRYADQLTGNSAGNVLTGGLGRDTLNGGGGNDVFDFNALAGTGSSQKTADIIAEFAIALSNVTSLTASDFIL